MTLIFNIINITAWNFAHLCTFANFNTRPIFCNKEILKYKFCQVKTYSIISQNLRSGTNTQKSIYNPNSSQIQCSITSFLIATTLLAGSSILSASINCGYSSLVRRESGNRLKNSFSRLETTFTSFQRESWSNKPLQDVWFEQKKWNKKSDTKESLWLYNMGDRERHHCEVRASGHYKALGSRRFNFTNY